MHGQGGGEWGTIKAVRALALPEGCKRLISVSHLSRRVGRKLATSFVQAKTLHLGVLQMKRQEGLERSKSENEAALNAKRPQMT